MNFEEEVLERELDAWWEGERTSNVPLVSSSALAAEIELVRALQRSAAPTVPTSAFATSLKVDLLMTATRMQAATPPSRFHELGGPPPAPTPVRLTPIRPKRRRFVLLEFAAAALLIFGMIGSVYRFGLLHGSNDVQPTTLPAGVAPAATAAPAAGSASVQGADGRGGGMLGPAPQGASPLLAWTRSFGTRPISVYQPKSVLLSSPAYANGRVFVVVAAASDPSLTPTTASYPDALVAIDVTTGREVWTTHLRANTQENSTPMAVGGTVIVPTSAGFVGFDAATGTLKWSYAVTDWAAPGGEALAVNDDAFFLAVRDGTLRAVDAQTGVDRWRTSMAGNGETWNSSYVSASNNAVYVDDAAGHLLSLDVNDGHTTWTAPFNGQLETNPVAANGAVYLSTYPLDPNSDGSSFGSGVLYALDAANGQQLWAPKDLTNPFRLSAAGGMVFTTSINPFSDGLKAFDGKTGHQLWNDSDANVRFAPVFASGDLFYAGLNGRMKAVDAATGAELWSVYLDQVSAPIVATGLLLASGAVSLFAVGADDGATATASSTGVNDVSGLPACATLRSVPTTKISGAPSRTVDAEVEITDPSGATGQPDWVPALTHWPEMLTKNLPTGKAASASQMTQLQGVVETMAACMNRADGYQNLAGFFTDDFFRRGVAAFHPAFGYMVPWFSLAQQIQFGSFTSAIILDDGRIAVHYASNPDGGVLVIFAKQHGVLMIDEVYRVLDAYNWTEPG